jgi:hypothetical protein
VEASIITGLYLYGIIPTGENIIFDVPGTGVEIIDVFTVPYYSALDASPRAQGIAGVVSASPTFDFNCLTRKEIENYQNLHRRALATVMQSFPVLPVRFGTVLSSEGEVSQMLGQGMLEFQSALEKINGRSEMEITITWDLATLLQEIDRQDAILFAKKCLSACSPNETAMREQALAHLIKTSLDQRRSSIRRAIMPVLHKITADISITFSTEDRVVLQASLLVDRNERRELDQKIAALENSYTSLHRTGGPALSFHLDGPFPPTHFSIVDVQAMPFMQMPIPMHSKMTGSQAFQAVNA